MLLAFFPAPPGLSPGGWRVLSLGTRPEPAESSLADGLGDQDRSLHRLPEHLPRRPPSGPATGFTALRVSGYRTWSHHLSREHFDLVQDTTDYLAK